MPRDSEHPRIRLRGLTRGRVRGALVVLEGAPGAELDAAARLCGAMCDRRTVVAVDGGIETCRRRRLEPDLFVGDGDSVRRVPRDLPVVLYPTDKDFGDLAGALGELRKRRVQVVVVAGLLGGRVDHEWANLLELAHCARHFAGFVAPTGRGTVVVTSSGCRAATKPGATVSLFALNGSATVTLRGTRWRLQRQRLLPGSRGLSNVTGSRLDLTVHAGTVAVVFPP